MENLQYFILEEVFLRYGNRTGTSLNPLINKLGKAPSDYQFTIDIKAILIDLEKRGIAKWDAEPIENKGNGFQNSNEYKERLGTIHENRAQTFENIYVEVQLTSDKGYDYAKDTFEREMIRKSTLSVNNWMKILTSVLAIAAILTFIVQLRQCDISEKQLQNELKGRQEKNAIVAERYAEFPGGTNGLNKYIRDNWQWLEPKDTVESNPSMHFVVRETGEITDIGISKSNGCKSCEEEAFRLIKGMPKWIPAMKDGKAVLLIKG